MRGKSATYYESDFDSDKKLLTHEWKTCKMDGEDLIIYTIRVG